VSEKSHRERFSYKDQVVNAIQGNDMYNGGIQSALMARHMLNAITKSSLME
jgi:hypothetical protein